MVKGTYMKTLVGETAGENYLTYSKRMEDIK